MAPKDIHVISFGIGEWQKELCRSDEVKDFEMDQLSWIIPVCPTCNRNVLIRGRQRSLTQKRRRSWRKNAKGSRVRERYIHHWL